MRQQLLLAGEAADAVRAEGDYGAGAAAGRGVREGPHYEGSSSVQNSYGDADAHHTVNLPHFLYGLIRKQPSRLLQTHDRLFHESAADLGPT